MAFLHEDGAQSPSFGSEARFGISHKVVRLTKFDWDQTRILVKCLDGWIVFCCGHEKRWISFSLNELILCKKALIPLRNPKQGYAKIDLNSIALKNQLNLIPTWVASCELYVLHKRQNYQKKINVFLTVIITYNHYFRCMKNWPIIHMEENRKVNEDLANPNYPKIEEKATGDCLWCSKDYRDFHKTWCWQRIPFNCTVDLSLVVTSSLTNFNT